MKFLIVDDSKVSRNKISKYIKELGHESVAEAGNGLEALHLSNELSPDIIIMDLEMPVMNGADATKEIIASNKNVNIVIVTSTISKKDKVTVLQNGAKIILEKPIAYDDFKNAIQELME